MDKRRIQVSVTEQEYQMLQSLARNSGKSVIALVREAVAKACVEPAERERRRAALHSLLSLSAPVSEWSEMEAEIARGALELPS